MNKIEHIGVAVPNLEEADAVFSRLLNRKAYKVEKVEREGVSTSFYELGESKIELLEATREESAIAKYIAKRGAGMHHVAIAVDDIRAEMQRLKDEGFQLLNEEPQAGADNKLICFLHPKTTCGVLVELCQDATTTP
jgi:methylmalonyl-CoA/ethylmalonyl-CoA epimerase